MKLFSKYIWLLIAFYSFALKAQQTGTITVTDNANINTINNQNVVGRDEVDVVPDATGEVHLLPQQTTDQVHLYLDPSIILPVVYASGGANTNQGAGGTVNPPNFSLPVGATGGTWMVGADGCSSYNIPVYLPPGTNGVMPSLSIQYSSGMGRGILGKGWGIGGLSSIKRVGQDLYHDGQFNASGSIALNTGSYGGDIFELDGNRLFLNSAPTNGPFTFVLEHENFSLIKYYPNSGNSTTSDYFTVQTPDGTIYEYGNTADSKLIVKEDYGSSSAPNANYAWYLNKVYDLYGNYILYTYNKKTQATDGWNEVFIQQIDYTGNINDQNATPYNSIKFNYSDKRTDPQSNFVQGNLIQSTVLLRDIEISCEGKFTKSYSFTYGSNSLGDTYLNQIQETGSDNSTLNPTVIEYGTPGSKNSSDDFTIDVLDATSGLDVTTSNVEYMPCDYNGDGKTDLIGLFYTPSIYLGEQIRTYSNWKAYKNISDATGTKFVVTETHVAPQGLFTPQGLKYVTNNPQVLDPINKAFQTIDVNADGYDDLIFGCAVGSNFPQSLVAPGAITYSVYTSDGTSFSNSYAVVPASENIGVVGADVTIADINGDKRPELIMYRYTDEGNVLGTPIHDGTFNVFSLQGDGKSLEWVSPSSNADAGYNLRGLCAINYDGDAAQELLTTNASGVPVVIKCTLASDYSSATFTGIFTDSHLTGTIGILPYNYGIVGDFRNLGNLDEPILYSFKQFTTCDVNGDGITDYAKIQGGKPVHNGSLILGTDDNPIEWGVELTNDYDPSIVVTPSSEVVAYGDNKTASANNNLLWNFKPIANSKGGGIFTDLNGDRRDDYIELNLTTDYSNATCGYDLTNDYVNISVAFSNGVNPTSSTISSANFMKTISNDDAVYDPNYSCSNNEYNPFPGDFDGDGRKDVLYTGKGKKIIIIHYHEGSKEEYVSSITDGLGKQTKFEYSSIAEAGQTIYTKNSSTSAYPIIQNFQRPIIAVSKATAIDGVGGTNTNNYTYSNATLHLNGLGFMGYGFMQAENPTTQIGVKNGASYIKSGNTYDFTPTSSETYSFVTSSSSQSISKTVYTPQIFNITGVEHYVRMTDILTTDGLTQTTNETVNTYDQGNLKTSHSTIVVGNSIFTGGYFEDQLTNYNWVTYTKFTHNASCLQDIKTTVKRPYQLDYSRETQYTYTDEGKVKTSIQDPGAQQVEVDYTYFPEGNVQTMATSSTDPNAPTTSSLAYTYDTKKRFLATFSNALTQVSQYSFDPKWGKPLSVTGVDNLTTTFKYDGYGKNIEITAPDGLVSTNSYDWANPGDFSNASSDPINVQPYALFKITNTQQGSPKSTVFFDILGRQVKCSKEGFNSPLNMVVKYDALGNLFQQSNSYDYAGNNSPLLTTYSYDILKNITNLSQTDAAGSPPITASYGYDYDTRSGNVTITAHTNSGATNQNDIRTISKAYDPTGLLVSMGDDALPVVGYIYGAHHNPVEIDFGIGVNAITKFTYDDFGRKKTMWEANTGTTTYNYNAYNQLTRKYDELGATHNNFNYYYDELGRIKKIESLGEAGNYMYDYVTSGNGINQLQKVTGPNGFDCIYTYDALNRPIQVQEDAAGIFVTNYTYDQYNNINKITYPNGFAITKDYDPNGYLSKISRADNGKTIWQTNTIDAFGNFSNYNLGNNVNVLKTFNDFGYTTKYKAQGLSVIQDYSFTFNYLNGDLTNRKDNTRGFSEDFTYDKVDRLSTVRGTTSLDMTYEANGNITYKSDVGNYTKYDPTQINAVTEIVNTSGNISPNTQTVEYNAFKKAKTIKETDITTSLPKNELDYVYGPDMQRRKGDLFDGNGNLLSTTFYQNNYEKIVSGTTQGNFTETNYISGGDGLCAVFINDQSGIANGKLYFVFTDYLGSLLKLTDENGAAVYEQSFDAWGKPRDPNDWNSDPPTSVTPPKGLIRGYTGHEHLPQFSLINMNGRVYDPITARMLSADEDVEDPGNTQNYNRYSYCLNNPLKYTDPSGLDAVDAVEIEPDEGEQPNGEGSSGEGSSGGGSAGTVGSGTVTPTDKELEEMINKDSKFIKYVVINGVAYYGGGNSGGNSGVTTGSGGTGTGGTGGTTTIGTAGTYGNTIQHGDEGGGGEGNGGSNTTNTSESGQATTFINDVGAGAGHLSTVYAVASTISKTSTQENFRAAQAAGQYFGNGTQAAAKGLSNFTKTVGPWGNRLGLAGLGISGLVLVSKAVTKQPIATHEKVSFGVSAGLIVAGYLVVGTAAAPVVGAAALIYGVGQLGSYIFTQKSLEENIIGK